VVLRALHLCSGYGGFELGLRLAGIPARTVAHVERDAYAAATLVARMADEVLDRAPIWSDLTTFDGAPWRGRVDLITAGFPCQPFSQAGQRRGVDDERWLWPDIARIVADVGPRFVFLENVPQLVRLGLPHVLADLADLGFDAEWGLLSAAAVGAPHRRERFWLLAVAHHHHHRLESLGRQPDHDGIARDDIDGSSGTDVADTDLDGLQGQQGAGSQVSQSQRFADVGDTPRVGWLSGVGPRQDEPESWRSDVEGSGRGPFPPPPDDIDGWERWIAASGPEPSLRRGADGRPVGLADALHLGGNGLVPRVAAAALRQLLERAGVTL
jgi:DNA (cytosine-5)-methyltransferase 1